jgi:soluble lytic murein transglycosylase-like protein
MVCVPAGWGVILWWRGRQVDQRIESADDLIRRHAEANRLPVALVQAVIRIESGGDPRAVSPKNARGLMQITPITEKEMLRRLRIPQGDLFDPDYNLRLGTGYLRLMVDRFGGNLRLALAAYNMGPTRLRRILAEYPNRSVEQILRQDVPRETAYYVAAVLDEADVGLTLPDESP